MATVQRNDSQGSSKTIAKKHDEANAVQIKLAALEAQRQKEAEKKAAEAKQKALEAAQRQAEEYKARYAAEQAAKAAAEKQKEAQRKAIEAGKRQQEKYEADKAAAAKKAADAKKATEAAKAAAAKTTTAAAKTTTTSAPAKVTTSTPNKTASPVGIAGPKKVTSLFGEDITADALGFLEKPGLLSGDMLEQIYGITQDPEELKRLYLEAVEKVFQENLANQKKNENATYDLLAASQDSLLETLRKNRVNAISTGATKGVQASQELSALLGLSQRNADATTKLAQMGADIYRANATDKANAIMKATTDANAIGSDVLKVAKEILGQNMVGYAADIGYKGMTDSANITAAATKSAASTAAAASKAAASSSQYSSSPGARAADYATAFMNQGKTASEAIKAINELRAAGIKIEP